MKKDFQKWHNKKSIINETEKRPFFHEKDFKGLKEKLKALLP